MFLLFPLVLFLWCFGHGFLALSFLFYLNWFLLLAAGGDELLNQNSDVIILSQISKGFLGERDGVRVECILHEELNEPMMGYLVWSALS